VRLLDVAVVHLLYVGSAIVPIEYGYESTAALLALVEDRSLA
jgi:hypothetical protein